MGTMVRAVVRHPLFTRRAVFAAASSELAQVGSSGCKCRRSLVHADSAPPSGPDRHVRKKRNPDNETPPASQGRLTKEQDQAQHRQAPQSRGGFEQRNDNTDHCIYSLSERDNHGMWSLAVLGLI